MAFLELNEKTLFVVTSKGVFTFCRFGVPHVSSFLKFDFPCGPSASTSGSVLPACFQVLASSLQGEEALLAVATSDKKVNKQPTALVFADNGNLLVADRVGEVTRLGPSESKPLLGHCSMLLDMDETVRIWDTAEGKCLHVIQLRHLLNRLKPDFAIKAAECRVFSAGRTLAVAFLHFVLILNLNPFQWGVKSEQCLQSDGEILDLLFEDGDHLILLQRLGHVALRLFKRANSEEPFEEYTDDFSVVVNGDSALRDALYESTYVQLPLRKLGSLADDGEKESKRSRIDRDVPSNSCFTVRHSLLVVTVMVCRQVWYFILLYLIGVRCFFEQLFYWNRVDFDKAMKHCSRLKGRTALVTGADLGGIGSELTRYLIRYGWNVIACCISETQMNQVKTRRASLASTNRLQLLYCDLRSSEDIKRLVKKIVTTTNRIHLFISNAGVMMPPYATTDWNGSESQWMVNYLAPVMLCEALSPLVLKAAKEDDFGRIVIVSSVVLHAASIDAQWFKYGGSDEPNPSMRQKAYCSHLSYANSKLAVALYARQLSRRLAFHSGFSCCSLHPGVANSRLFRHTNPFNRLFLKTSLSKYVIRSTSDAAKDVLWVACAPDTITGEYYENSRVTKLPKVDESVESAISECAFGLATLFR
ncbi:adh short domain containing protein [Trichuris trichiura]|uniref:Adh short domain containing protein n=1 Tax=Trichuris trichiura TaxID=36087 RepID=A0A077ZAD2_TRITR|nr:adh short domain containing protein [Trichuris trichiura]